MTGYEKRMKKRRENKQASQKAALLKPKPIKPKPRAKQKVRDEIHCHSCGSFVQFTIDIGLDGNHLFNCPNCKHEHYRVVRNGKITSERWGQDPSQNGYTTVYYATAVTCSIVSSGTSYTSDWASVSSTDSTVSYGSTLSYYTHAF